MNKLLIIFALTLTIVASRRNSGIDFFKLLSDQQKQQIEDKFNTLKDNLVDPKDVFEEMQKFASSMNIPIPEPPQHRDHRRPNFQDSDHDNNERKDKNHGRGKEDNQPEERREEINKEASKEEQVDSFIKSKIKNDNTTPAQPEKENDKRPEDIENRGSSNSSNEDFDDQYSNNKKEVQIGERDLTKGRKRKSEIRSSNGPDNNIMSGRRHQRNFDKDD